MYVTACGKVCESYSLGVQHERSCEWCQDIIAEEDEDEDGRCHFCGEYDCDGFCEDEDE